MTPDGALIAELAKFGTPAVFNGLRRLTSEADALQALDRRVVRCTSPSLGVRVGFAATEKVKTGGGRDQDAVKQSRKLAERFNEHIYEVPEPRIVAVEVIGDPEGPTCIWGEVMANVYRAMGCTGGVTNGPVRDVLEMEAIGFQTFSGGIGLAGGFAEVIDVGEPVTVGGVTIAPGDLVHADLHGVMKVPIDLAAALPDAMRADEEDERRIISVCQSADFSLERLAAARAHRTR